jgi:hypothetical protein
MVLLLTNQHRAKACAAGHHMLNLLKLRYAAGEIVQCPNFKYVLDIRNTCDSCIALCKAEHLRSLLHGCLFCLLKKLSSS